MITAGCPTREMIVQYSLGLLSEEQAIGLASHLDSCPDCQAMIMTLDDADDTVIGRLRAPASHESFVAEPQLEDALAAAIAMPERPSAAAVQPVGVGFHLPPQRVEDGSSPAALFTSDMPQTLGEYRLLEELGRGGMGRVYKALHTKLDRIVALKVLSRGRMGDQQAIARFEREMKAVGRLAHKNIVQAHDAREIDGTSVLIMEFVDGLDLAKIVHRVGPVPVAEACELVRQTALALQCAHEHGLVHRDIKPSNIMLTHSGEVKLLDLGLARFYDAKPRGADCQSAASSPAASLADWQPAPQAADDMTGTGQAMGTADYMAPEQASDCRTVDIRADLYSLGCTLYKLLSGRAPFSGPDYRVTLDKLNAHVHEPAPLIRRLVPDVPERLAAILDRLLAKDPDDRFATPAEVAEAITPWCVGADLQTLAQRAIKAKSSRFRAGEDNSEGSAVARESAGKMPLLLTSWGWKWLAGQLILLLIVGGLAFAFGIMIRIQKDGQETTVDVPPGSSTTIDEQGNPTVSIAGTSEVGKMRTVNAAAEFKALQGKWKVSHIEIGRDAGESWPVYDQGNFTAAKLDRFHFREDYLDVASLQDGSCQTVIYRIDPTKSLKTIDLAAQGSSDTPGRLCAVGVYEIQGDRLLMRLARFLPSVTVDQRPKSVREESGTGEVLFELERYRPSDDEKAIQGKWAIASLTEDGKVSADEANRSKYVRFSDDFFTVEGKNQMSERIGGLYSGVLALNPENVPKSITFFNDHDPGVFDHDDARVAERERIVGIYELKDGRITIAFRRGDMPPDSLESKPGSGVTILVLQRARPSKLAAGGMGGGSVGMGAMSPAQPPEESPLQFSSVVERVVNAVSEGKGGEGLDLAGGRLVDVPKEFGQWSAEQQNKWSAENNVDLVVDLVAYGAMAGLDNKSLALVPEGVQLAAIGHERWHWQEGNSKLQQALESASPGSVDGEILVAAVCERHGITYYVVPMPPVTFAFQTRKGSLGILQVVRYTEEPRGMRIRYKLVQPSAVDNLPPGTYAPIPGVSAPALPYTDLLAPSADPQSISSLAPSAAASLNATDAPIPSVNAVAELKALQGQWKVLRVEKGHGTDSDWGNILEIDPLLDPADVERFDFFVTSPDDWMLRIRQFKRIGPAECVPLGWCGYQKYRIDPTATPKTIDILHGVDNRVGATGIYELEGDRLKLCLSWCMPALRTAQRPKGFRSEADSASILFILERFQPPQDEKTIEGEWTFATLVEDGKPVVDEELRRMYGSFYNDFFSMAQMRDTTQMRGTPDDGRGDSHALSVSYVLDTLKQPRTITFFRRDPPVEGGSHEVLRGIYMFDADRLTIAYRKGDLPPEQFESKSGSGVTMLVLQRAEPPKTTSGMGGTGGGTSGIGGGMGMPVAPQPKEPALQFGPVIERVVNAVAEGKGGEGLDLVGGKLVDVPKEFGQWSTQQKGQWASDNNVDLLVEGAPAGQTDCPGVLVPEGMLLAAAANRLWNFSWEQNLRVMVTTETPGHTEGWIDIAVVRERAGATYYELVRQLPLTFAFQTRKGDLGILQVIRFTEEPRGMRIRYKLVQSPAAALGPPPSLAPVVPSTSPEAERRQVAAIEPETLDNYHPNQFASVRFPLLTAELQEQVKEKLAEVQRLLGPRGSWSLTSSELTIVDEAGRVGQVRDLLKRMEVAAAPDEKAIQGTWEIVGSKNPNYFFTSPFWDADLASEEVRKSTKVLVTGETIQFVGKLTGIRTYDYQMDQVTNPKEIDIGINRGYPLIGIYELKGNELKICAKLRNREPGAVNTRPADFHVNLGASESLLVLRRVDDATDTIDTQAYSEINGDWQISEAVLDDKIPADVDQADHNYVAGVREAMKSTFVSPGAYVQIGLYGGIRVAESLSAEGRIAGYAQAGVLRPFEIRNYAIDPTTEPKRIWYELGGGRHGGIYKLEGDRLTICLAIPTVCPRVAKPVMTDPPTELAARPSTMLLVLKRVTEATGKAPSQ